MVAIYIQPSLCFLQLKNSDLLVTLKILFLDFNRLLWYNGLKERNMVEVDFTKNKELYDYFKKVWKSGGTITIAGINSLGNEFETTGRIATDFLDNISVYESFIYLNFGKWWRRDWIAPYFTIIENSEKITPSLFIKEIKDTDGNVIFTNPNFKEIERDVKKNAAQEKENEEKARADIIEDDAVTEKLREMIGQPIVLEDDDGRTLGVLTEIRGAAVDGSTSLFIRSGVRVEPAFVNESTTLFSVALNGNEKCVANNASRSLSDNAKRIMRERRERFADHSDPEAE